MGVRRKGELGRRGSVMKSCLSSPGYNHGPQWHHVSGYKGFLSPQSHDIWRLLTE